MTDTTKTKQQEQQHQSEQQQEQQRQPSQQQQQQQRRGEPPLDPFPHPWINSRRRSSFGHKQPQTLPYPPSKVQFASAAGAKEHRPNKESNPQETPHRRRTSSSSSSNNNNQKSSNNNPQIIIVGAGAAGLGAAHRLRASGILEAMRATSSGSRDTNPNNKHENSNIVILEATHTLGGRMQTNHDFTGYPLDLGPSYLPGLWFLRELQTHATNVRLNVTRPPGASWVWKNYSYHDYFREHIAPGMDIQYGCVVTVVDSEDRNNNNNNDIAVQCADGRTYTAPYVIVTASLQVLQDGDILFRPPVPRHLLYHRGFWPGLKVFLQFPQKFYDTSFCPLGGGCYNETGETLFWDGTVSAPDDNNNNTNLLVGYLAGDRARGIVGRDIVNQVTEIIQDHFDLSLAPPERFLLQDWREQPYVKGLWSGPTNQANFGAPIVSQGTSMSDGETKEGSNNHHMLLLAGEAYPIPNEEWAWVYSAFHSGFDAAERIIHHWVTGQPWITVHEEDWERDSNGSGGSQLWNVPSTLGDVAVVASSFCPTGSCVRLRDDSGAASSIESNAIDASIYAFVRLSFDFYMHSFEGVESFLVEMRQQSKDSSWQTLATYVHDQGLIHDDTEHSKHIVIDTREISGAMHLRFRCEASGNQDQIYLDNIAIGVMIGTEQREDDDDDDGNDDETQGPSESPTVSPTASPTSAPSNGPTLSPNASPTTSPSSSADALSTDSPTESPIETKTASPTNTPSQSPTTPTSSCANQCLEIATDAGSCSVGCPGCLACQSLVCQQDPYCCERVWDRKCVDLVHLQCT